MVLSSRPSVRCARPAFDYYEVCFSGVDALMPKHSPRIGPTHSSLADMPHHVSDPRQALRCHFSQTRLGGMLVAAQPAGVVAVFLGDDESSLRADLARRFHGFDIQPADARTLGLARNVSASIDDPKLASTVPIAIHGTIFQRTVWKALREIPIGSTCSYTQLAHKLGMPRAARAVASACAANPLSVLIPCHRVVGADGHLRGYAWGLERKQALLEAEAGHAAA